MLCGCTTGALGEKKTIMDVYKTVINNENKITDILTDQKPDSSYNKASEKEKFDFYLKQGFIKGNTDLPNIKINGVNENFGFYISRYKKYYDRYFSNNIGIKNSLSFEIQKSYDNGKGNEFKNGKFYSVASSSRFAVSCFSENVNGKIFLLDKIKINGEQKDCKISLEKELDIFSINDQIISHPQMDVVINLKTGDIYFIEVKCHEIFDNHREIRLKSKYKDTDFIKTHLSSFSKLSELLEGKEKFIAINNQLLTAKDFDCNLKTYHFDFKQFLCHLMGILQYQKENNVKVHFYYLFFKNTDYVNNEKSKIYEELRHEIEEVFSVFSKKYKNIDFGYIYNDKFDTIQNIENNYT